MNWKHMLKSVVAAAFLTSAPLAMSVDLPLGASPAQAEFLKSLTIRPHDTNLPGPTIEVVFRR